VLSKRDREQVKIWRSWERYEGSEEGRESFRWTRAQRCLDGTATDDEYNSLDRCYASYDGAFVYVGPRFGPLTITGPTALKAWNRACNYVEAYLTAKRALKS